MIDWDKLFFKANVEKQVNILNDTLLNIFSNFVRSKVITINDRNPPWINEEIKCRIESKSKTFQHYFKNGRKIIDFENVDKEAAELSKMIQNWEERYFYDLSVKLNNAETSPKTYWSIIKSCYNVRKIPIVPSYSVNGKIITDFNEKANLFNKYFHLNAILYQMIVSYQKIKHILQKLSSFNIEIKIYTK